METGAAVKIEPVWFLDDEKIVSGVKKECTQIDFESVKREIVISSCKEEEEENTCQVEDYKTGGRTYVPQTSSVDEKQVAMFRPQFQPLCNPHDSSADYLGDVSTEVEVMSSMEDVQDIHHQAEEEPTASTATPLPEKKKEPITQRKRALEDMAERIISRRNIKNKYDNEVHEKRMKILYIEEDIKKKERDHLMKMNEVELQIKRKQLDYLNADNEEKALELKIKRLQYSQLSGINK